MSGTFKTNQWLGRIDQVTNRVKEVSEISIEQLNQKPTPDSWSIGQLLDHIITTNETYWPVLAKIESGSFKESFLSKIGFLPDYMGGMILKSVQPEEKKKYKTVAPFEPTRSDLGLDIFDRFTMHQVRLKSEIEKSINSNTLDLVISSPASKLIMYRLGTAFDIIVSHEERHLLQITEIRSRDRK